MQLLPRDGQGTQRDVTVCQCSQAITQREIPFLVHDIHRSTICEGPTADRIQTGPDLANSEPKLLPRQTEEYPI